MACSETYNGQAGKTNQKKNLANAQKIIFYPMIKQQPIMWGKVLVKKKVVLKLEQKTS